MRATPAPVSYQPPARATEGREPVDACDAGLCVVPAAVAEYVGDSWPSRIGHLEAVRRGDDRVARECGAAAGRDARPEGSGQVPVGEEVCARAEQRDCAPAADLPEAVTDDPGDRSERV